MTARTRRTPIMLAVPAVVACALIAAPAIALAGRSAGAGTPSGGAGVAKPPGAGGPAGTTATPVAPADSPVSATGNGITLETLALAVSSTAVTFNGTVAAAAAGRTVAIERASGPASHPSWTAIADATVMPGGAFTAVWRANVAGRVQVDAVLLAPGQTASTDAMSQTLMRNPTASGTGAVAPGPGHTAPSTPTSSPPLTVEVFPAARATLYGPGFYGQRTACGKTLAATMIGVASRSLPCGTRVALLYGGHELVVPVIDRGPYANGATWDLTIATAHALGIEATTTIGALALTN